MSQNISKKDTRHASKISGAVKCPPPPPPQKKTGKKCDELIAIAHLNPGSVFISFTKLSSFKASATAALIANPSLDKLMEGWTRSFHGNQPNFFQARHRPLTSPGTAMARPPRSGRFAFLGSDFSQIF